MRNRYLKYLKEKGYAETSITSIRCTLTKYEEFIKEQFDKDLVEAAGEDLEKYREYLSGRISKRTLYTWFGFLRKFYDYCKEEGLILLNPAREVDVRARINRIPQGVPTEREIEDFLGLPDEYTHEGIRDKAIMELMYSTGIRRRELAKLMVSDVGLNEKELCVREGKGGDFRVVPVGKEAVRCLKRYLEITRPKYYKRQDEKHLFLTRRGTGMTVYGVQKLFMKYKEDSGMKGNITPHSLRHACALHMLRAGASIAIIRKLLGHKHLSTTQIYTRLYPKDLKDMHKKCHPREKSDSMCTKDICRRW